MSQWPLDLNAAEDSLELLLLWPPLPKHWHYRHTSPLYFVLDYSMLTVQEILVHCRAKLTLLQAGILEERIGL